MAFGEGLGAFSHGIALGKLFNFKAAGIMKVAWRYRCAHEELWGYTAKHSDMKVGPWLCYLAIVFLSNSIIINPYLLIVTVISISFYSIRWKYTD